MADECGDFDDPSTLASDVRSELTLKASQAGIPVSITTVACHNDHDQEFLCDVDLADGDHVAVAVTVAEDGRSWRSHHR